jgi:hypothetical protein
MRILVNKSKLCAKQFDFNKLYTDIAQEMMLFSEGNALMAEKRYDLIPDWFDANTSNEAKTLILSEMNEAMNSQTISN